QVADAVRVRVVPDLFPLPVREEADLPEWFASGKTVKLNLLEILARWRLFAAQTDKPNVKWFQCSEKRFDLAQLAATRGISLVENAECRLLFRHGSRWENVEETQRPLLR